MQDRLSPAHLAYAGCCIPFTSVFWPYSGAIDLSTDRTRDRWNQPWFIRPSTFLKAANRRSSGCGSRCSTGFDSFLIMFIGFFPRWHVNSNIAMGKFYTVFPERLLYHPEHLAAQVLGQVHVPRLNASLFDYFREEDVRAAHAAMTESGAEVALTPKEFKVLRYFVSRVGRALTRDEIMAAAWGSDILVTSRSVDRCIATLRGKIEPDPHHPRFIQTIRDIGYRFEVEAPDPEAVASLVGDPSVIAVGPRTSVNRLLGQGADFGKILTWVHSRFSLC